MFFLSFDVTIDLGQHRLTYRERAVSLLPLESRRVFKCSRDPAGGIRLQFTNQLRDCLVLSQLCQDVNVVDRSVDDHRDSFFIANRAAEIFMRSGTNLCRQPRLAPLCRKDYVIEQIAIGGTHSNADFRRPLPGLLSFGNNTPGVPLRATPGFNSGAPSGCYLRNSIVSVYTPAPRHCTPTLASAPKARQIKARCAAQRNSGNSCRMFSNPWQGVTENRFASTAGYLKDI